MQGEKEKKLGTHKQLQEGKRCCKVTNSLGHQVKPHEIEPIHFMQLFMQAFLALFSVSATFEFVSRVLHLSCI